MNMSHCVVDGCIARHFQHLVKTELWSASLKGEQGSSPCICYASLPSRL